MKELILLFVLILISFFNLNGQEKHPLTVEDIWSMNRIGNFDLSPDGKNLVFSVTNYCMEENSGDTDIWIMEGDGSNLKTLKNSEERESQPKFSPDGKRVAYVYNSQIWICDLDGTNNEQLTDIYTGASDLSWINSDESILFVSNVYPDCESQDCNKRKDEEKENSLVDAEIFTELMYRHWNDWRGPKRSHLFLFDTESKKYIDLTLNSPYDVPPIALGSSNDYSVSPNGDEAAYTMNKSDFLASSTNNDVFNMKLNDLNSVEETVAKKISESGGNDNQPVYSPDGKFIAFTSMERSGFEADKKRLMIFNRENGKLIDISKNLNISFDGLVWSPDSRYIYYTAANEIYNSIFRINIESGDNKIILKEGVNSSLKISNDGRTIYFKQQVSNQPYEIFSINSDGNNLTQITFLNNEFLKNIETNDTETFWCEGAEGTKVQSVLIKPPFFNPAKKYPMIFLIHGGPQGHWSDDFHYRWNMQLFASRGYVVVAPNPRGSTGYGQKFTDEISEDWGGKVYVDLMNVYDYAIENFKFIDENNTFAAGASYGGYMIAWVEGHTDRFNALVNHDGVYNLESMYGTTEELWFPEWEMGGTPWENPDLYKKWSPSSYVKNFKTPMLIIHGGKDFRVPEGQAFELFTALQKMGVPSKFLYYPNETHFVLKPQNAKFWWNTIFDWFEQYKR